MLFRNEIKNLAHDAKTIKSFYTTGYFGNTVLSRVTQIRFTVEKSNSISSATISHIETVSVASFRDALKFVKRAAFEIH